jgi:flavin-dependent dehydrogenase
LTKLQGRATLKFQHVSCLKTIRIVLGKKEVTMAKRYDMIVVGAGPAGFLAAKAAGGNRLDVALLERKPDPTQLTRACGQSLISMNEYFFKDIVGYNARDKWLFFPVYGFSFKYDGPYQNIYSRQTYTANGHKVQAGDGKEQRKNGDHGRIGLTFDKEILFQCLLEEVKACCVDVFSGINV